MAELHVGVVIHGCADVSVRCVRNLVSNCRLNRPVKFHLLDNGSPSPDSVAVLLALQGLQAGCDNVEAILFAQNRGCATGWNTIIRAAQLDPEFKYVILVGHDVICHPDALENLVLRYERGGVDIVTGVPYEQDLELTPREDEAPGPDFSMILLSKKVIDTVGLFDENFFPAYFEDNDYHHRCKLRGCGFGIRTNLAPFRHYRSSTIRAYPDLNRYFEQNRRYFISKWGGPPETLTALVYSTLGDPKTEEPKPE